MNRYVALFRIPNVWVLVLTCFPARVAYGMVSLSIFFKVEQSTGSISSAGLALGLNAASGALTAGIRGSVMDKYGQKWPLRIMVPTYATLTIALNLADAKATMLTLAFVMGLSAPPINLSVRPLWKIVVPEKGLRTAYAVDSSIMNFAFVVGPVIATSLALSRFSSSPLFICAALMLLGGISLGMTKVSRNWIPETKGADYQPLWKHKPLQLLMIEGCFIGFGWGLFDVAVPAFTTIEKVPHMTAWIFAAMGVSNVVGGLLAGLVSKKTSSLKAMRRTYGVWFFVSIPMALSYPNWTMIIAGAFLGLVGGAIQVFYWEVMEAIRPQGSPTAMMGWLWSVEGMLMAVGSMAGGFISEHSSPTIALSITALCIGAGYLILALGKSRLIAADRIPTDDEDLAAMKDNANTNQ
jgi:MFS family permease|uniref:MFS transporter n=1 Tax=Candidatus Planktophila sp. TaxID=2175601 RepID=UPI004049A9A3